MQLEPMWPFVALEFAAMKVRVGRLRVLNVEVDEDRVRSRDHHVSVLERWNRTHTGCFGHCAALLGLESDISCTPVKAELRQSHANAVGVRAPLGLKQLQH
jgi:hypothetical protein